jgi:endonuclease G
MTSWKTLIRLIAAFMISLSVSISVYAEGYLELRRKASLYAQPDSKSMVIQELDSGLKLREIGGGVKDKGYWKVEIDGGRYGYIYQTLGRFTSYNPSALYLQSNCSEYLPYGIPKKVDQVLCRLGYVSGYSYQHKIPMWVAYTVTYSSSQSDIAIRNDKFLEDISLSPGQYRVLSTDYENSGYDKGHMAPSSLIDATQLSNDQTFLMSNIVPQRPWINRDVYANKGVWGAIEDSVSCWVKLKEHNRLYVISGVITSPSPAIIGNGVTVPQGFFKIIIDLESMESISFIIEDQEKSKDDADNLMNYVRTIDYIEGKSGMDFFNSIDMPVQEVIESSKPNIDEWRFYDRQPELGCVIR